MNFTFLQDLQLTTLDDPSGSGNLILAARAFRSNLSTDPNGRILTITPPIEDTTPLVFQSATGPQQITPTPGGGSTSYPQKVAYVKDLTQGSAEGTTTLFTTASDGFYRVSVYATVGTSGTGTLTCPIGWTDTGGAYTNGTISLNLGSTANQSQGQVIFHSLTGQNITYSTSIAGLAGVPKWSIYFTVELIAI